MECAPNGNWVELADYEDVYRKYSAGLDRACEDGRRVAQLKAQNEELRTKYIAAVAKYTEQVDKNDELRQEANDARDKCEARRLANEALSANLNDLCTKLEQKLKGYEHLHANQAKSILAYQTKVVDLERQIDNLKSENYTVSEEAARAERLRKVNEELRTECNELRSKNTDLGAQNAQLRGMLTHTEECRQLAEAEYEAASQAMVPWDNKRKLSTAIKELGAKYDELSRADYWTRLGQLTAENEELRDLYDSAIGSLDKIRQVLAEREL